MTNRSEPIKHTCPDIDNAISVLLGVIQSIDESFANAENINDLDFRSWISDIEDIALGTRCELEKLRDSNSILRDWGNALASDLNTLDDEIETLNKDVSNLERKIDEYVDMVSDLEEQLKELERELQTI